VKSLFLLRGINYFTIGLVSITLLVLALISVAKAHRSEDRLRGLIFLALAIIGLCTLFGLIAEYPYAMR